MTLDTDFTRFKTVWQGQEFEGYLFQKPPGHFSPSLQMKVKELRWRLAVEDGKEMISSILLIVMAAIIFRDSHSFVARLGMVITMISAFYFMILLPITGIKNRMTRMDLPMQMFCRSERDKINSKIRQRRLRSSWYLVPTTAGIIVWFATLKASIMELVIAGVVLAGILLFMRWMSARKIRRDLLPVREELDRKIWEFEGNSGLPGVSDGCCRRVP